jgi:WD40 repeat protein
MEFSPDVSLLAIATYDGNVTIIDTPSSQRVRVIRAGFGIKSLRFDSPKLLRVIFENSYRVYDVSTGALINE